MERPLVSIITPCYNGETFLDRYFKSILSQTYPNIELIFVNDGSTDRTEEIALSYKEKLEEKGIQFIYIYQDNAGQAAAINQGLSLFRGKYLTWPDSDDWMTPDCVERKALYLESHPEKGWVQCKTAVVHEDSLSVLRYCFGRQNKANGWLFEDLIFEHDIYFAPGGYMVRSEALLKTIPTRHIYECKTGQNWQLMLPVSYMYECGFLEDVLYYYVVRADSHSRTEKNYATNIEKTYRHADTLVHVLSEMDMPDEERNSYCKRIEIKYIRRRMQIAAQFHETDELKKYYAELKSKSELTSGDRLCYLRANVPLLDFAWKVASRCKAGIKRIVGDRL